MENTKCIDQSDDETCANCKYCQKRFYKSWLPRHEAHCKKSLCSSDTFRLSMNELSRNSSDIKNSQSSPVLLKSSADLEQDETQSTGFSLGKIHSEIKFEKCPHCGRNFSVAGSQRHIPVCEKIKRAKGTPKPLDCSFSSKALDMKHRDVSHEYFLFFCRNRAGIFFESSSDIKNSQSSPVLLKSSADLEQGGTQSIGFSLGKIHSEIKFEKCPHCGRNFSVAGSQRHIPVCEKIKRAKGTPKPLDCSFSSKALDMKHRDVSHG